MTDCKTILITIADALYRQAGYVPFPWHISDVRHVIEDRELSVTLTDAECLQVLDNAFSNSEVAEFGVTWDTIEAEIETLVEFRTEGGQQ